MTDLFKGNLFYPLRGKFLYPRSARKRRKNIVKLPDLVRSNKVLFLSLSDLVSLSNFLSLLSPFPFKKKKGKRRKRDSFSTFPSFFVFNSIFFSFLSFLEKGKEEKKKTLFFPLLFSHF